MELFVKVLIIYNRDIFNSVWKNYSFSSKNCHKNNHNFLTNWDRKVPFDLFCYFDQAWQVLLKWKICANIIFLYFSNFVISKVLAKFTNIARRHYMFVWFIRFSLNLLKGSPEVKNIKNFHFPPGMVLQPFGSQNLCQYVNYHRKQINT